MEFKEILLVFDHFLETLVGYIWGLPLVIILVGSGILFSLLLKGVQFRGFCHALKIISGKYNCKGGPGEISSFQALTTALSATIGLGNIGGVAVAIQAGGPGAVFWMVLVGIFGMATKYAECTLSVIYRKIDENGKVLGGPIQYIVNGLGPSWKFLAIFFAVACTIGAFNLFQVNQAALILKTYFSIPEIFTGCVMAIVVGVVIIGGIKRIGLVTSYLVPFMSGIYVLIGLCVVLIHIDQVPTILQYIISGAFTKTAAIGGFTGVVVTEVIIQGVRRACFSNEAGLGTAPIAHAAASTNEPVREGIAACLGPFIDTILCSMTAFVILISGVEVLDSEGVQLTSIAFDSVFSGFGSFVLPIIVTLFACSTSLGWAYYGEVSVSFLCSNNEKCLLAYKIIFCLMLVLGSIWSIDTVLNFIDIMLGLMVFPNLIAIWLLFPKLKEATRCYFKRLKSDEF